MRTRHLTHGMLVVTIVGVAAMGCSKSSSLRAGSGGVASEGGTPGAGGETGVGGGSGGTGGMTGSGGQTGMGGHLGTGGAASGGSTGAGGTVASGGTAGRVGAGGTSAAGGTATRDGGNSDVPPGKGGAGSGGTMGTGGAKGGASGSGAGGTSGSGGATTVTIDCSAAMPANGVVHSGNSKGTVGNLAWQLWSNQSGPTMTTFDTPAFRLTWGGANQVDTLARLGLQFGDAGTTYDQYGTITAQFAETKSGTGGGYSYIGVYGVSIDPCAEFYIVDDSYMEMPFKAYNASSKGTVTIDGGSYALYSATMSSTDTSSCRGQSWKQYYSVRQTARTCGQIPITEHFNAWNAAGMKLGALAELAVFVEVGGGTGSIDFPIANVMIQP